MREKIKVIHVIPDLGTGGAEKLVIDLVDNIDNSRFDMKILSLYGPQNSIYEKIVTDKKITIDYLDKKNGFDFNTIIKVIKFFIREKPDIIHTHRYVYPYIIIANMITRTKVKIHTVHNIAEKELPKKLQHIMKFAYKFLNCTPVGISDYIKSTICNTYNLDYSEVPCIYNGIDTNRFKPREKNENSNFNYINYINIGRMSDQKNHLLLIEAFKYVSEQIENCKLTIIGDGELRSDIEKKINDYKLNKRIDLLGIQKNTQKYLSESDVFVLSSNYEGLPLSVLEAMSCELPIITTKAGGTIDIVKQNKNGIVVNVNDKEALSRAMIKLGKSKNLRKKMGEESLKESSNYDVKIMAKNYEELYLEKLQSTGK